MEEEKTELLKAIEAYRDEIREVLGWYAVHGDWCITEDGTIFRFEGLAPKSAEGTIEVNGKKHVYNTLLPASPTDIVAWRMKNEKD